MYNTAGTTPYELKLETLWNSFNWLSISSCT